VHTSVPVLIAVPTPPCLNGEMDTAFEGKSLAMKLCSMVGAPVDVL
jgi:hypothetical protein